MFFDSPELSCGSISSVVIRSLKRSGQDAELWQLTSDHNNTPAPDLVLQWRGQLFQFSRDNGVFFISCVGPWLAAESARNCSKR